MDLLQNVLIQCPCCWEPITVSVDTSQLETGPQEYVEDCQVCCNPLVLCAWLDENRLARVRAAPEQEW